MIKIQRTTILLFALFALTCIFAVVFKSYFFPISGDTTQTTLAQAPKHNETDPAIKEFGLNIEKIGILAPVVKDVDGAKRSTYNKALEKGIAHYKGTTLPGQNGNIFLFAHSSSLIGKGPYSQIFAKLNDLEKGDKIIVYFENKEYEYFVDSKKVVKKDDVSVVKPTKKEQLTLMTCWPIGSNIKRLIVIAKPK